MQSLEKAECIALKISRLIQILHRYVLQKAGIYTMIEKEVSTYLLFKYQQESQISLSNKIIDFAIAK